jgi:hypothetical protein
MKFTVAILFFACLLSSAKASVIDVSNLMPHSAHGSVDPSGFGRGQTFQMGQAGSLNRIAVSVINDLFTPGQATLKLYELTGTEVTGIPIPTIATSTANIAGGNVATIYDFNFSGLNFPAGKKLAFGLYGDSIVACY